MSPSIDPSNKPCPSSAICTRVTIVLNSAERPERLGLLSLDCSALALPSEPEPDRSEVAGRDGAGAGRVYRGARAGAGLGAEYPPVLER
jgi:hypothetical protein